jgi:hypothetical protein
MTRGRSTHTSSSPTSNCFFSAVSRTTFFSARWPQIKGDKYFDRINGLKKLVASTTLKDVTWNTSVIRRGGRHVEGVGELEEFQEGWRRRSAAGRPRQSDGEFSRRTAK